MRPTLIVAMFIGLAACSGGEFNHSVIDASRLPVDKKGNLFFGREMEW